MAFVPVTAWAVLDERWKRCLELAWEAYGAGTIPVGAVLVDERGGIVAEGRNRVYEPVSPAPQIARSLLAHAEVNALVGLDPEQRTRITSSTRRSSRACCASARR